MSERTYSAGLVTAYGAAVRGGYRGTYAQFCAQQAEYAENAAAVEQAKTDAQSAATGAAGAATSAGVSATSAESSATSAEASATAAAGSATTAGQHKDAAATSATNAASSATEAAASATSAASSASAAQAVLESIPEEYSDLSEDVDKLKADLDSQEPYLYDLTGREYTVVKTNKRIALSGLSIGDTADLTPVDATNYGYIIIGCSAGESFMITANAGSGFLPWACLDRSNTILSIATKYRYTKERFVTPTDTAKVVITLTTNGEQRILRGADIVGALTGKEIPTAIEVVNGVITLNGSETNATSYRRTPNPILIKAGQTVKVTAKCGVANALISEWTESNAFIQTLIAGTASFATSAYTADKDTYIKICYSNSEGCTVTITDPTNFSNGENIAEVNAKLDTGIYEWERVLNSVCCIGDSLTRGAYYVNGHNGVAIEQNYPYFFAKQTGLTVQNEGLSGSSPSSRWNYFATFDFTPYNAFFIWWGTNGGLTDTLLDDGVIDSEGALIEDYTTYADTNTGDYCKTIGRIISQVPHAKIFLGTIFTTSSGADATNAVIEKIAELYPDNVMGIVDNNDGTLYTLARRKLTPSWVHIDNTTHFSMVGNYYLAVHWIKAVRAIIAENPAKFEDIMEDILAE